MCRSKRVALSSSFVVSAESAGCSAPGIRCTENHGARID